MGSNFVKRTSDCWNNHKKRAAAVKQALDYSLHDLRNLVRTALDRARCPYCLQPLNDKTWSCDHKLPVSRGGLHSIGNLVVTCRGCNLAKGNATDDEYKGLLKLLLHWHPEARKSLIARLKRGGRFC